MSSACIEHLDFLDLSADVERTFRTFQEKDKGKHYRSLTEIPKLVKMEMEEAWSKDNVSVSFQSFTDRCRRRYVLNEMISELFRPLSTSV